jgi:transposase, IS30 family
MSKQLTATDRAVLAQLLDLKLTKAEIARRLEVHRSTVYRELVRNTGPRGYLDVEAQQRTNARRMLSRRKRKLDEPALHEFIGEGLRERWSPDQIAGRLRRAFPRQPRRQVSRQTIYTWIKRQDEQEENGGQWRAYLRFGRPRRKRGQNAGRLPGARTLEGRPKIVEERRRFGDWEGDTVVSCGRRGGLASLVERKSGYTLLAPVSDLKAPSVRQVIQAKLVVLPALLRRTITFDNGKEFAEHHQLAAATGLDVYFAKPYCAWQRGTNENTNGLVRQYWPKGTDFHDVSHRAVADLQSSLNDRPRKRLGYRTPREVLAALCAQRRVAFAN